MLQLPSHLFQSHSPFALRTSFKDWRPERGAQEIEWQRGTGRTVKAEDPGEEEL